MVEDALRPYEALSTGQERQWQLQSYHVCSMLCVCPAGHEAAGTPHLLLGLLDCKNAAVNKAIEKQAGISLAALRAKVNMFPLPSTACMHTYAWMWISPVCGQKCT
jgi:hypothetical protein